MGNRLCGGGSGKVKRYKKILKISTQTHGELEKSGGGGGGFAGRELPTERSQSKAWSNVVVYIGGKNKKKGLGYLSEDGREKEMGGGGKERRYNIFSTRSFLEPVFLIMID